MSEEISELSVRELITGQDQYLIPMYQRNYAWDEGEIDQLIQDIEDSSDRNRDGYYYIGSLVVFRRQDGRFEVIDGQQRLTTLNLMAAALGNTERVNNPNLDFEARPRSREALRSLFQGIQPHKLRNSEYSDDIVRGYELIAQRIDRVCSIQRFLLDQVHIMRIEVPPETDLNHYFEVMNNRGEQLEKHEVLKARFMSALNDGIEDDADRKKSIETLNKVWSACANMGQYVQLGFEPSERGRIFGNDWSGWETKDFKDLIGRLNVGTSNSSDNNLTATLSLRSIIEQTQGDLKFGDGHTEETPGRFHSVINFSNFLLHVLRAHTEADVQLDDKRLLGEFDSHLKLDAKTDSSERAEQVQRFVFSLLKCRYLFDRYIIKREYAGNEDSWSLKTIKKYASGKFNYVNSIESNGDNSFLNHQALMLLAAFHVSTPTMVYKHWLTAALAYLYDQEKVDNEMYIANLERVARDFVFRRFLTDGEPLSYYQISFRHREDDKVSNPPSLRLDEKKLSYGNIQNNLVFNYLDYLLWKDGKDQSDRVVTGFEFTFRSSVEHLYPQHPLQGHGKLPDPELHSFGNLCLISHSKNSRLSNYQPKAKAEHFRAGLREGRIDSLKLYEMIKIEEKQGWGVDQIKMHSEKMIGRLKKEFQSSGSGDE